MDLGLFKVAAVPRVKVADVEYNAESICRLTAKAEKEEASLVVFPSFPLRVTPALTFSDRIFC